MDWSKHIEQELERLSRQNLRRALTLEPERSFSHNDYLGLGRSAPLHALALERVKGLPTGSGGSRLLGGHSEAFRSLEEEIADFFGSPTALFFPTGYLANVAAVVALGTVVEHVVCDEKLHASLIDGVRLTSKPKSIVPHQRWEQAPAVPSALVIAESLYSMDADTVRSDALLSWREQNNAFLLLDEAHACGVMDETGRGLSQSWRDWRHTAVIVTFGKAFGVSGAALLCAPGVRDLVVNAGRGFIYSTAPSPWLGALVSASLAVMKEQGGELRQQLWSRVRSVREIFRQNGVTLAQSSINGGNPWDQISPIVPLSLPGNDRALRFANLMREFGWGLKAIRYPTVPRGSESVRISLNLRVSQIETLQFAEKVVNLWKVFS